MATAAKTILAGFDLTATQKTNNVDKTTHRRNKLISKIEEQILVVQAMLNGEEYFSEKVVKQMDEDGNELKTTVPKRVNKWFYTASNKEWHLEVKYGNRALQLAPNKTAIIVGAFENMVSVIEQVKQAVLAGELDKAIEAIYKAKK